MGDVIFFEMGIGGGVGVVRGFEGWVGRLLEYYGVSFGFFWEVECRVLDRWFFFFYFRKLVVF